MKPAMSPPDRNRFASITAFCRSVPHRLVAVIGGAPEHKMTTARWPQMANEGRRRMTGAGAFPRSRDNWPYYPGITTIDLTVLKAVKPCLQVDTEGCAGKPLPIGGLLGTGTLEFC